jgi:hypothetical protein
MIRAELAWTDRTVAVAADTADLEPLLKLVRSPRNPGRAEGSALDQSGVCNGWQAGAAGCGAAQVRVKKNPAEKFQSHRGTRYKPQVPSAPLNIAP